MSAYLALHQHQHQPTLVFNLGDLIIVVYTAALVATFTIPPPRTSELIAPADAIVSVSERVSFRNSQDAFMVSQETASSIISPLRYPKRDAFSSNATHQLAEELCCQWYDRWKEVGGGNVPYSRFDTLRRYGDCTAIHHLMKSRSSVMTSWLV